MLLSRAKRLLPASVFFLHLHLHLDGVALKSDGTVYAGQPAVHLVRRALAATVLWPVML